MRSGLKLAAILVLAAAATPAAAVTNVFTGRTAFNAAMSNPTVRDFNAATIATSFRGVALDIGGATVRGYGVEQGNRNVVDVLPLFGAAFDIDGTANLAAAAGAATGVVFTFAAPVMSFGADFANLGLVSFDTGSVTLSPAAATGASFFGFVTDTAFTRLQISGLGAQDFFSIDNIVFGGGTPVITGGVPEPATWALMIGGFGLTGAAMRRRMRLANLEDRRLA